MEKTMRFLSIAALALVGAVMTGCSNEDNFTAQPQQLVADKGNVVTVTATVGLGEQAGTRAMTAAGVKTFAEGDQIAVIYQNTNGTMVKVETTALTDADISTDGKSAKITVTMTDPKAGGTLKYIYPAAMAGETDVDYTKLNSQDGSLDNLGKKFDLAVYDGNLTSEAKLPASATLENQLAILALTIKDNATTPHDLTNSITSLSVGDGTNIYSVTRSAAEGPIYVAIKPTNSATIGVNATDGTTHYYKELTSKTYAKDNGYSVSWKMDKGACLAFLTGDIYEAKDGETLTGALAADATTNIKIADNATVTLKDVTINGTNVDDDAHKHAGITCAGDATIILEGENTVKGFYEDYPGIQVLVDKTLTIQGTGSLTANGSDYGAGIGGGYEISCGNIVIKGGTITATGGGSAAGIGGGMDVTCGAIYISGGTVTATGVDCAAGIGGGYYGSCGDIEISGGTVTATGGRQAAGIGGGEYNKTCGDITIKNTVTKVTAKKGENAPNSIGKGDDGEDITVKIGDDTYASGISANPYTYPAP